MTAPAQFCGKPTCTDAVRAFVADPDDLRVPDPCPLCREAMEGSLGLWLNEPVTLASLRMALKTDGRIP